jgi:alpha-beta hydrolase superfamily lysophospholipase
MARTARRSRTDEMAFIIDHPMISRFLFYPRMLTRDHFPKIEYGSIHTFPSGDGEEISAYWYKPHKDSPTILMFHGNGEVITDYLYDFHEIIASLGANFAIVDYRGYGLSHGEPTLSAVLEDSHAAWSYFTEKLGLKPSDIILFGRSLGSIPALELASSDGRDSLGVIIESGIAGFHRWIDRIGPMIQRMNLDLEFDALKDELKKYLDHESKVSKISRPMLIMHTEHDQIVPSWNAHDLYSWADPKKTFLKIFPEGDHNTIFFTNAEEYFGILNEFISNLKQGN